MTETIRRLIALESVRNYLLGLEPGGRYYDKHRSNEPDDLQWLLCHDMARKVTADLERHDADRRGIYFTRCGASSLGSGVFANCAGEEYAHIILNGERETAGSLPRMLIKACGGSGSDQLKKLFCAALLLWIRQMDADGPAAELNGWLNETIGSKAGGGTSPSDELLVVGMLSSAFFGIASPAAARTVTADRDSLLIDPDQLCGYVFGVTPEDGAAAVGKGWDDSISAFFDDAVSLRTLAGGIVREALKYPLFNYLIDARDVSRHVDEVRELLKITARYNGRVVINTPVGSMISWARREIRDSAVSRSFTVDDFIDVLGGCADAAAVSGSAHGHEFSIGEIAGGRYAAGASDALSADIAAALRDPGNRFLMNGSTAGRYKFRVRQYRLLFAALRDARAFNMSDDPDDKTTDLMIDRIQSYFTRRANAVDDPLSDIRIEDDRYDVYVFYAAALISALDTRLRGRLLARICRAEAIDFSVERRPRQIGFIFIATYLLCEDIPLTYDQREMLFTASYGRTLYKLQAEHWGYIRDTSSYFMRRVGTALDAALSGGTDQPLFWFLYGYYFDYKCNWFRECGITGADSKDPRSFLGKCAVLQMQTWYGGMTGDSAAVFAKILDGIDVCHSALRSGRTNDISRRTFAYAGHMLCYALANLLNGLLRGRRQTAAAAGLASVHEESEIGSILCRLNDPMHRGDATVRQVIIRTAVLSDYYSRSLNPLYGPPDADPADHSRLYLPCGAFRVICVLDYIDNDLSPVNWIEEDIVCLDKTKTAAYLAWTKREFARDNTRYGLLLLKLLAKTFRSTACCKKIKELLNSYQNVRCDVLNYDYLPRGKTDS